MFTGLRGIALYGGNMRYRLIFKNDSIEYFYKSLSGLKKAYKYYSVRGFNVAAFDNWTGLKFDF